MVFKFSLIKMHVMSFIIRDSAGYRMYLAVSAGLNHLPCLRVYIVAVQLIGQRVIRRSTKHIEVAIKRDHGVAVAPLWRRRGTSEQMLGRDTGPPVRTIQSFR